MALTTSLFNLLTLFIWTLMWVFWVVSAFTSKRNKTGISWAREGAIRVFIIIVVIILVRSGIFHFSGGSIQDFLVPPTFWFGVIGVIICACGVGLAIWARITLGRNWGMPMTLKEDPELITSGPYAIVRHPIYAGFLFAVLGSSLVDGLGWLILFLVVGVYFTYSALTEEKLMLKQFPKEYPNYMAKTKAMIPFVW